MHPPSLGTPLPHYRVDDYQPGTPPPWDNSPPSPPPTDDFSLPPQTELAPALASTAARSVSPAEAPPPSHRSPAILLIAGLAVLGLLLILGLLCAVFFIWRAKRNRRMRGKDNPSAQPHQPGDPSHHIAMTPSVNNPQSLNPPQPSTLTVPSQAQLGRPLSNPRVLERSRAPRIFTYEELESATKGFAESNKLGRGGFGTVYKGVLPPDNEIVAVKKLNSGAQGKEELETEIKVINQARHKHIVSLVGYYIDEDEALRSDMLLVYEFIPNDSLQYHLHGTGTETIDWETRMKIAIGSAKGLRYLHEDCEPKIIHCDIKPHNILLQGDFQPKIADFGLAQLLSDTVTHVSQSRFMGTFGYLAPEYILGGKISEKSDVFAFGVVLLELITGRKPSECTGGMVIWATPLLIAAVRSEDRDFEALADPRLRSKYEPEGMFRMVSCAAHCVCRPAARRPRMSQVVQALEGTIRLNNDDLTEDAT